MLLSVIIVCAVGTLLLLVLGAFDELREIWTHPDHKDDGDEWHHPKPNLDDYCRFRTKGLNGRER